MYSLGNLSSPKIKKSRWKERTHLCVYIVYIYIHTDVACVCIYCKYMFRFKIPSKVDCTHVLLRNQSRKTLNHVGWMKREPKLWVAGNYTVPGFEFSVLFYMLHDVPECLWYFMNFIWLKNLFIHNMIILFTLKLILLIILQKIG